MPDLTIEIMQMCEDLKETRTGKTGGYEQFLDRDFGIAHCTCPAFKYRKGRNSLCKHLEELESRGCHYHEQVDGPPEVDGVCPRCGNPTVYIKVGV